MNKVILSGNLVKDVDLRKTESGMSVVGNTIAVRRERKNFNGEYDVDFINFVVWDKSAEYLNQYANKGDRIELVGRWQVREYEEKNGNNFMT